MGNRAPKLNRKNDLKCSICYFVHYDFEWIKFGEIALELLRNLFYWTKKVH